MRPWKKQERCLLRKKETKNGILDFRIKSLSRVATATGLAPERKSPAVPTINRLNKKRRRVSVPAT